MEPIGKELGTALILASLSLVFIIVMEGCLTPQGRALRSVANTALSTRLTNYCAARTEAERQVIASAINNRLYFAGQVRVVCPE